MKRNKKNILSKAGVLFITAVMVLTVLPAVMSDETIPSTNLSDNPRDYRNSVISTERVPDYGDSIDNIKNARKTGFRIPYNQDGSFDGGLGTDAWIHYDDPAVIDNAYGLNVAGDIEGGILITPTEWASYSGWAGIQVDAIKFYYGSQFNGGPVNGGPHDGWIAIYEGAAFPGDPTTALASATFNTGDEMAKWMEVAVSPAVSINPSETYWIAVGYTIGAAEYPCGIDGGPYVPGKGDWLRYDTGSGWVDFFETLDYNQHIHCGIKEGGGAVGECIEDACDFELVSINQAYMFNGIINELPQTINITVRNNGEVGINELKLLADVYKKVCGPTTPLYCDPKFSCMSTTEPCDPWGTGLYENWTMFDDNPNEIHMEGDTWVLQCGEENNWVTNNQAFRNTKGEDRSFGADEDKYLGLSDTAHGYDNLTFNPLDHKQNNISGAACATVTFSHWAEGEYTFDEDGFVIPVDYGFISYRINDGTYLHDEMDTCNNVEDASGWTMIPLSEFVAYDTGGAWEPVTIKFLNTNIFTTTTYAEVCDDCDPECDDIVIEEAFPDNAYLEIRFSWVKDPCCQYEGWYIDEFCITRTEMYEKELVHQTHIIMPLPGCDPEFGPQDIYVEFPLGWDPEPQTWYQIDICGQVFSPNDCEYTTENNCIEIQFYVDDIHDLICKDFDILTPPPYREGDSITVNMTVQNIGTFAEDNVPVVLKTADCIKTAAINDEFETDPSGRWNCYYFTGYNPDCLFDWTEGDPSIDNIWEIEEAAARSVLPGDESFLCAHHGTTLTLPYLTEGTGNLITDDEVYDFIGDGALAADLSFYAKWSLEIEQYYDSWYYEWYIVPGSEGTQASLLVHPTSGPDSAFWWIVDFGAWYHNGEYHNDWIRVEADMLALQESFGYPEECTGEMIIPAIEFGWGLFAEINDGDCTNPTNPIPWSGLMLDRINLEIVTCGGNEEVVAETTTGALAPGEEQTLTMTWSDAEYCAHCLIGDINLPGDQDTSNDICQECILVTNVTDFGDFQSMDLTGEGDCLWHICTSRDGGDDCYAWAGVEETHWCHYVDNMDDSWISPPVNLTIEPPYNGGYVNFTHWYKFFGYWDYNPGTDSDDWVFDKGDFGEVYIRGNASTPWKKIAKITGDSGGYFKPFTKFIAPEDCGEAFQVRFRMKTNDFDIGSVYARYHANAVDDVDEGWYVDDVEIGYSVQAAASFGDGSFGSPWYCYGWNDDAIGDMLPEDCSSFTQFGTSSVGWLSGGTWAKGEYYACYYDTPGTLYTVDTTNGALTAVGNPGVGFTGIAYDPVADQGYGIYADDSAGWETYLYSLDFDTGAAAQIGQIGSGLLGIDIGYDVAGGVLYMHDIITDSMYTVDTGSGTPNLLGPTGIAANFGQGMEYDVDSDKLYALSCGTGAAVLHEVNKATGFFTDICTMTAGSQFGALAIPYEYSTDQAYGPVVKLFDFEDDDDQHECSDDGFICVRTAAGDYWRHYTTDAGYLPAGATEDCDGDDDWWVVHDYPSDGPGLNDIIYTEIDLTDELITHVEIGFSMLWDIETDCDMFIEISDDFDGSDMTGATWIPFWTNKGPSTQSTWLHSSDLVADDRFVLNQYLGEKIHLRFRYTTPGEGMGLLSEGGWAVDCFTLGFKATTFEDNEAPVTSICFNPDTGEVTLLAVDYPLNKGCGVKATYYKIDGGAEQTYTGTFTLSEGSHTVEYWSEDNCGNTESHKTASYTIDTTPPTVDLTQPVEGKLYLLGNPIMDRILGDGTLCIGNVPVAADATDGGSGVELVLFTFDNGDSGFDDDGSNGFTYTWRGMHFGELTITAVAVDGVGLSSSPDSMTVTVYSLGLL